MAKKDKAKKHDLEFHISPETLRIEKQVSFCGKIVLIMVSIGIILFYIAYFIGEKNKDLAAMLVRMNSLPLLLAVVFFSFGVVYYKKWQKNRFVLVKGKKWEKDKLVLIERKEK